MARTPPAVAGPAVELGCGDDATATLSRKRLGVFRTLA